jgi:O-antigen/teichoic acid export membrane protein
MTQAAQRRSRLIYGFTTSLASKATALGLQLFALPIFLHALGTDKFAIFIAVRALLSWTGLLSFGLIPTLPSFIAAARTRGDIVAQRNFVLWPLFLLLAMSFTVAIVLIALDLIVPANQILSISSTLSANAIRTTYIVAVILQCALLFTSAQLAIRSGYQEIHRTSIISTIANVISLLLVLIYGPTTSSVAVVMAILLAPLPVLLLLDMIALFREKSFLLHAPKQFRQTWRALAGHSSNALAVQIAFLLFAYLPPLAVALLSDSRDTAAFGALMQLSILGANSLNLVFQPLLAAIADARSHGHWQWIRRNYMRGLILVSAVGLCAVAFLTLLGPWAMKLWLHKDIGITRALCAAFGCYFLLMTNALYHFYALSGLGQLRGVGRVYVLQGVIAIGLGSALCWRFGSVGMSIGLALGLLVLTSWYGPLKTYGAITKKENSAPHLPMEVESI